MNQKLGKLAWVAVGLLLASFPLRAQQTAPTEEVTPPEVKSSAQSGDLNDLKGDKLGENRDVFTANHPKLRCVKRDSLLSDCHVWEDVSIAGIAVHGIEKCDSEAQASSAAPTANCLQGIDAHFVSELLAGVSYLLEGDDASKNRIVAAFKQQYGEPTSDDQAQTIWSNDLLVLSVTILKTGEKTSYVAITLDLKPSEVGEDI